jgi:hypothetical protein
MKEDTNNKLFKANDELMFRENLIGYEHSTKTSQKVLYVEENKHFNIQIVHFISFDDLVDDCCVLHVNNNITGETQVNLPSKNFRKLLKHAESFRY